MVRKKQITAKEPVRIRYKELANGNRSVYLDIYKDGKRTYEFLKLYLRPEKDAATRAANLNTLQAAKAIQAQRVLDLANGKAGLTREYKKMLLVDWLKAYQALRAKTGRSGKRAEQIGSAIKHVEAFLNGRKASLGDVDTKFLKAFIAYLSTAQSRTSTKNPKPLSKTAAHSYFIVLASALKEARRQQVMFDNPLDGLSSEDLKPIKAEDAEVGYLTIDEVQAMAQCTYPCQNKLLRRAFLFACFTGFRISDIRSLKWGDIKQVGGSFYVHKLMVKTMTYVDLPLPEPSLYWLPNKGDSKDDDFVFPTAERWSSKKLESVLPITQWCVNTELCRWAKRAGVNKHLTFHMSRHTYATMLITKGADVFTVQKLLGHKSIQSTQVYAELVGKKKREAVNLLNSILEAAK
jgi:integrase